MKASEFRRVGSLVSGAFGAYLSCTPCAQAADVTVNCPTGAGADYARIGDALNALAPVGPHTITVRGTCEERVGIGDGVNVARIGLSIVAAAGETATITPPPAGQGRGAVVLVCGSHAIYLERLIIRGGGTGLTLCDAAEVDTTGLTIEDNVNDGVNLFANSTLFFVDQAVIRNNGPIGVIARGSSAVAFLGRVAADGTRLGTLIEGHRRAGIVAIDGSVVELLGPHQVQGNGTAGDPESGGISIARTSSLASSARGGGGPEIGANTGYGVSIETGSSLSLQGTTLPGNSGAGARLRRLSVGEVKDGNSFAGNGTSAISCDASSWAVGDLTGIRPLDCKNVEGRKK